MEPEAALMNVKPDALRKCQFSLMFHVLMAAKHTIAMAWLSDSIPYQEIFSTMRKTMVNKKLTAKLSDAMAKFETTWLHE